MSSPASSFRGVRLGILERTLFVNAPPLGTVGGLLIEGLGQTPSEQKGYLRAAKKLAGLGLVQPVKVKASIRVADPRRERVFRHGFFWLNPDPTRQQMINRVAIWATHFGEGIKLIYEPELTSRRPIRWTDEKLKLAQRYEQEQYCSPESHEAAIDMLEARLVDQGADPTPGIFRAAYPDGCNTDEQKFRWRCSTQLARRGNPKLGTSGLWDETLKIFRSRKKTKTLAKQTGPMQHPPQAEPALRFKRLDLGVIVPTRSKPLVPPADEAA